ncbi:MAG: beta-glucosidase [Clostridiales bacterium]|nr:beta-glucosidase [Clostridiales bacterium]
MKFPKNFIWGAAAAAYQIEGAYNEDGKGLNIWDIYSKDPGRIAHGENGDIACDHYHRFKEDIKLMKEIGIKHYRLSLNWTRIIPDGTGEVNQKGVDFYNQLLDTLIENEIEPMVTLFHWDYPYELHCKGGWLSREASDWFENYAKTCTELFSDKVKYWMTINEPQVFVGLGYYSGLHAPFYKLCKTDLMRMTHNILLSHGKAVRAIRKYAKQPPIIGFAPTGPCVTPENETKDSIEIARQQSFEFSENGYVFSNSWWGDPIVFGKYNDKAFELFGDSLKPLIKDGDMEIISAPIDFYGANIYSSSSVGITNGYPSNEYIGCPRTAVEWVVTDDALYWATKFLNERYKLPILITENGMACHDWVHLDGKVHDPNRIDYTARYLKGLKRATSENIDVMGYLYWSILDNFEWNSGYDKRFGLIYVDYQTQKRTIKDSGYWFGNVIKNNGENI